MTKKDYGEGPILAMVERMRHESVDAEWMRGPRHTVTCYGPGYYWAILAAAKPMGDLQQTLIPGRLVSLAAALAIAAMIAAVVARRTESVPLGLFCALLFLSWRVVEFWVPFHRTDVLSVVFSFAAYVAASRDDRRGLLLAALLIGVGSLVKQTVALSAMPIFLYYVLNRRYSDAAIFAMAVSAAGAVLWGAIDWASGGYFLTAAIRGNLNNPSLIQGLKLNFGFWVLCPASLATIVVLVFMLATDVKRVLGSVFCVGFVVEVAIAMAAVFKEGAAINYFIPACALGATIVGVHGLSHFMTMSKQKTLIAVAVVSLLFTIGKFIEIPANFAVLRDFDAGYANVEKALETSPSEWVLVDGGWTDAALAAGAKPMVNDPILLRLMEENGTVDSGPLRDAMSRGEIRYLVLNGTVEEHREQIGNHVQKWSADVIQAMEQHYHFAFTLDAKGDKIYIYRHRRTKD